MLKRMAICLVATLACLAGSTVGFAQLPTATVLGTVTDQTGAVVPGATVTARNTDTNDTRATVAGADGSYRLNALPVGNYEIRAESSGFKTAVHSGLTLTVGQEQNLNFALQIGSNVEEVTVTTDAPTINTTSGDLGGTVNEESMADLPLNGRDYIQLALLQAGTTLDTSRTASSTALASQGSWFSSNGDPVRSNAYLLDGTNLGTYGGASGASISGDTLGLDGIREFRIVTNSFDAEYGMVMGSQMAMVSRSGTNTYHGDAFEYIRNNAMDARNYFDTPQSSGTSLSGAQFRLPPYRRNNFGGAVGGPIIKDRTFYYANYEGVRQLQGLSFLNTTIPNGCRGAAGATITPAACPFITANATVNASVAPFIPLFTAPNDGTELLSWGFNQADTEDYGQLRLDQTINAKDSIFARYTGDADTIAEPGDYPGTPFTSTSQNHYITVAETHIFSASILNTARGSFSFTKQFIGSPAYTAGAQYSFEPGIPMGGLTISGLTASAFGGTPTSQAKQYVTSYSDDLFDTKGRHTLKVGALINHYKVYAANGINLYGSLKFSNYATFLAANSSSYQAIAPGGINYKEVVYDTIGGYVQDDYKVTPRLTLNLGLRYEINSDINVVGPSLPLNGAMMDPLEDVNFTPTPWLTENPSYHNFSPRAGFAYDLFGNNKTSIRGGFGELYQIAAWLSFLHGATRAPFGQDQFSGKGSFSIPFPVPTGTSLASLQARSPAVYDWNMKQPKIIQYNLAIQQALPSRSSITIAYGGSEGYDLQVLTDSNPVVQNGVPTLSGGFYSCVALASGTSLPSISQQNLVYGPTANTCNIPGATVTRQNNNWGPFNGISDSRNSWYNSLQVEYRKDVSHGLQVQSNVTYSKLLDDTQGATSGAAEVVGSVTYASDPWNPMVDRGPASFNTKYNWKTNVVYHLPKVGGLNHIVSGFVNGWWGTIISQVTSGYPFTVNLSNSRSGMDVDGSNVAVTDRPNQNTGRNNSNITSGTSAGCTGVPAGTALGTVTLYFDPCAYTIQSAGFLGTTSRNSLVGPNYRDVDTSLVKDIGLRFLGEGGQIELRGEVFNIFNRVNFQLPNNSVFAAASTAPATGDVEAPLANSGTIVGANPSRKVQLAVKVLF